MTIDIQELEPFPWVVYDRDRPSDDQEVAFADTFADAQYAASQYQAKFA